MFSYTFLNYIISDLPESNQRQFDYFLLKHLQSNALPTELKSDKNAVRFWLKMVFPYIIFLRIIFGLKIFF
jgi:hypothetical protein